MFSMQLIVYSWNTWHSESLGCTVLPAPLITLLCSTLVMCSTLMRLEIHWRSFLLSIIQREFGSNTYIDSCNDTQLHILLKTISALPSCDNLSVEN